MINTNRPKLKGIPKCGCNKCGIKLGEYCCCSHTCKGICVTLEGGCSDPETGTPTCTCEEPTQAYFEYDSLTNSYHGTINCGDLSIDLEFIVKYCSETSECKICLISDCLKEFIPAGTSTAGTGGTGVTPTASFDGDCTNGVSCKSLSSGTLSCIGCRDNTESGNPLIGGIEAEWEIDVSNCGDTECTSFKITTKCIDRIFPHEITGELLTGTGTYSDECGESTNCGCTGCDCLCRYLCFSYYGSNLCVDGNKIPIDGDTWTFEVNCDETDPTQTGRTIVVRLTKNETTGQCELVVTTDYTGTGTYGTGGASETIIPLTTCPEIPFTTIYVDENLNEYFTFGCYECGDCPEYNPCVCRCDPINDSGNDRGFIVPDTLTLAWSGTDSFGSQSGGVTLVKNLESCVWEGQLDYYCIDSEGRRGHDRVNFTLQPDYIDQAIYGDCTWLLQICAGQVVEDGDSADATCDTGTPRILIHFDTYACLPTTQADTTCNCDPFELTYLYQPTEDITLAIEITEN